jgi:hypothetical protein
MSRILVGTPRRTPNQARSFGHVTVQRKQSPQVMLKARSRAAAGQQEPAFDAAHGVLAYEGCPAPQRINPPWG